MQKCKIRGYEKIPSYPGRSHRNHLIQSSKSAILVAQRGENLCFACVARHKGCNSFSVLPPTGACVSDAEGLRTRVEEMSVPRRLKNPYCLPGVSMPQKILTPAGTTLLVVRCCLLAMGFRFVKAGCRSERDAEGKMGLERDRIDFLRCIQLAERLLDPAKRQQQEQREMIAPQRVARGDTESAPETMLRRRPLRFARLHHPKPVLRVGRQGIQLDGLCCSSPSFHHHFCALACIESVEAGSSRIPCGDARISGSE